jgi:hypothetical protein
MRRLQVARRWLDSEALRERTNCGVSRHRGFAAYSTHAAGLPDKTGCIIACRGATRDLKNTGATFAGRQRGDLATRRQPAPELGARPAGRADSYELKHFHPLMRRLSDLGSRWIGISLYDY